MINATDIRPQMDVIGSDGAHVGTVDHLEGDRIKLTRVGSADDRHHYVPLSAVSRIDSHVHLNSTAAALGIGTAGAAAASAHEGPLPPTKNRAVDDPKPRGNFYLPWIVGIVGLVLLILLLRSCLQDEPPAATAEAPPVLSDAADTPPVAVERVTLPDGRTLDLAPQTLNYELQRYLASNDPAPRTFTFDRLNFATGSAEIRSQDVPTVEALAGILAAYPAARIRLVGYTDSQGNAAANEELGEDRAEAVEDALEARGIDDDRIETASGGQANPAGSNRTADGRLENRRTELIVTRK